MYYSSHTKYYAEDMPDLYQPAEKQREIQRPPHRELLGPNVGQRITFAVRGSGSVRSSFHNVAVELPLLTGHENNILLEHPCVASAHPHTSK